MATVGTIEQYQGPFNENSTLTLNGKCIIGISIGEDDYMKLGSTSGDKSFRFLIIFQSKIIANIYVHYFNKTKFLLNYFTPCNTSDFYQQVCRELSQRLILILLLD